MKKFRKIVAIGLTVAMSVGLLSGCGSSGGSSSDKGAGSSSGGTVDKVTIGLNDNWNDISPFGTMSAMRTAIMYSFYEYAAVRKDFGCSLEDMELECAKEINKVDDLTYDVVFYDNIKDAAGNEITAEDYAWSATEM